MEILMNIAGQMFLFAIMFTSIVLCFILVVLVATSAVYILIETYRFIKRNIIEFRGN